MRGSQRGSNEPKERCVDAEERENAHGSRTEVARKSHGSRTRRDAERREANTNSEHEGREVRERDSGEANLMKGGFHV
jgi:hypothetical protein